MWKINGTGNAIVRSSVAHSSESIRLRYSDLASDHEASTSATRQHSRAIREALIYPYNRYLYSQTSRMCGGHLLLAVNSYNVDIVLSNAIISFIGNAVFYSILIVVDEHFG